MSPEDDPESIIKAAGRGDIAAAASLLERHPEWVAYPQRVGGLNQPLHFAAGAGHLEMVDYLLGRGAPVDARDRGGMTPLHRAARNGQRAAMERLIAAGADVRARDHDGRSALYWAIQGYDPGRQSVVDLLLGQGLHLDVYCALILGDWAEARRLLEGPLDLSSGASLNTPLLAAVTGVSTTALGIEEASQEAEAACREVAGIIRSLVAGGASLGWFSEALYLSVKLNNTIVLECRLEIAASRPILSEAQKSLLGPRLLNASQYSIVHEEMSGLLARYGFSDRSATGSPP